METEDLSLAARSALRMIRALRKLPETSGTIEAERRFLKKLNVNDTIAVALALDKDDSELGAAQ